MTANGCHEVARMATATVRPVSAAVVMLKGQASRPKAELLLPLIGREPTSPPAPSSSRPAFSLNAWITSRTVSSSAATSRAIAGTSVPDADAMMIIARRTPDRPVLPPPHDLQQPPSLLITQPPRPHRLSHLSSRHSTCPNRSSVGASPPHVSIR